MAIYEFSSSTMYDGQLKTARAGIGQVKVTISSRELKDLVAHPVTLVPAPGVGKVIWPLHLFTDYKFVSLAYPSGPANLAYVIGADINNAWFNCAESNFADQTESISVPIFPVAANVVNFPRTLAENQPLRFVNKGTDLTDGDGTLTISCLYEIVDLGNI